MTAVAFDPDATDFGTDTAWNDDLAPVWGLVSAEDNVAQAAVLRLSQRTGSMDFYDPKYVCLDLRGYLSAKMNQADVSRLQGRISAAMESDPRIASCTATVSFDFPTFTLTVVLALQTAEGPFDLVLQASKVTVSILAINGVTVPTLPVGNDNGSATVIQITGGSTLPGPPGPPGASNPSRSYGLQPVESSTGTEDPQLQSQIDEINWGALGGSLTLEFGGMAQDDGGTGGTPGTGVGVIKLRINGSDGAADGTAEISLNATSASATPIHGSVTISNPGGFGRAIVTVTSSAAGKNCSMRGITFTIQSN